MSPKIYTAVHLGGGAYESDTCFSVGERRFLLAKKQEKIKNFVRSSIQCSKSKPNTQQARKHFQSIQDSESFVFWAMYSMGLLSEANKHIPVLMGHCAKWDEVFPNKDQMHQLLRLFSYQEYISA